MNITQLRNATIVVEFGNTVLLVDPMLAPKSTLPALRWLAAPRRKNPLVDLPATAPALLEKVTHALITHCQRGHFDHLDRAGAAYLRERQVPVFCMPKDATYLEKRGLRVSPLVTNEFFGGRITPVACVHGRGVVGSLMEHGAGYFIELPGEPTLYLAGDTVLTDEVRQVLSERRPTISVLPAGGARFDFGGDIIMSGDDVCAATACTPGVVIANHLEALDHCPTTRAGLHAQLTAAGLRAQVRIPLDGETLEFRRQ